MARQNVLVFAPHADDETLGCGGAIAKHVNLGDKVHVVVATGAGPGEHSYFPTDVFTTVRSEFELAMKILGVTSFEFLNLPSTQLDQIGHLKVNAIINNALERQKPSVVYVPYAGDLHNDHVMICEAVTVATRPYLNSSKTVEQILAYETLSETHLRHPSLGDAFQPNVFINISNFMEAKVKALECYQSQLQKRYQPRTVSSIKALASIRGAHIGVEFAEAYVLLGEYRRKG